MGSGYGRREGPGASGDLYGVAAPTRSRKARLGWPSGTMPNRRCSSRTASRRSKSKWPSKSCDLVAERGEPALERNALLARGLEIVGRPCAAEWRIAAQPVGKRGDRERIGVRIVESLEHDEVVGDEKGRPGGAARKKQDGVAGVGQRAAIGAAQCRAGSIRQTCRGLGGSRSLAAPPPRNPRAGAAASPIFCR